jgi:molybdenum cofactor biosynthesis enzyme
MNHFDAKGNAWMVDVAGKPPTERVAVAGGFIWVSEETLSAIKGKNSKKGDVLGVAQVAGIMAAKKTGDIIPLCHPLTLTHCSVEFTVPDGGAGKDSDESETSDGGAGKDSDESETSDGGAGKRRGESEASDESGGKNGGGQGAVRAQACGAAQTGAKAKIYGIKATCTVKTFGQTGVEMEALTGVSVALLTIYDMCKSIDRGMVISDVCLLLKDGGKSGRFERGD